MSAQEATGASQPTARLPDTVWDVIIGRLRSQHRACLRGVSKKFRTLVNSSVIKIKVDPTHSEDALQWQLHARFPRLEHLEVIKPSQVDCFTDTTFAQLALKDLSRLSCLASLNLENCTQLTVAGMAALALACPAITRLVIPQVCQLCMSDSMLLVLARLPDLAKLRVQCCKHCDEVALAYLSDLRRLTALELEDYGQALRQVTQLTSLTSLRSVMVWSDYTLEVADHVNAVGQGHGQGQGHPHGHPHGHGHGGGGGHGPHAHAGGGAHHAVPVEGLLAPPAGLFMMAAAEAAAAAVANLNFAPNPPHPPPHQHQHQPHQQQQQHPHALGGLPHPHQQQQQQQQGGGAQQQGGGGAAGAPADAHLADAAGQGGGGAGGGGGGGGGAEAAAWNLDPAFAHQLQLTDQVLSNIFAGKAALLDWVAGMTALTHVDIQRVDISGPELQRFGALPGLLHLGVGDLSLEAPAPALPPPVPLPSVTKLVSHNIAHETALRTTFPSLRALSCDSADSGLGHIGELTGLVNLFLWTSPTDAITDSGLAALSGLRRLETFRLEGSDSASNDGWIRFAEAHSCLTRIDLVKCPGVTDIGFILSIGQLQRLQRISFVDCPGIDTPSLAALLAFCPQLDHIELQDCSAITLAAVRSLLSSVRRPDLDVIYRRGGASRVLHGGS